MGEPPETEITMFHCHVCGGNTAKQELVSEIFTVEGRPVQVVDIPAQVCERCGEPTFGRETTEKIRQLVHSAKSPVKTVAMDVFAFATGGATPALVREKPAKYGK
jgi:HTH-type transcriptional regulator / antitoxin MqsA